MTAHVMEIVHDREARRGWYLSWRCTTKGCAARGDSTAPTREVGMRLFGIVADGHARSEGDAALNREKQQ